MSNRTGNPAGASSQEDPLTIMTQRSLCGDFRKFDKENLKKLDKWKTERLDFRSSFASALDRYETTLELKQTQEQAAIGSGFPAMVLGIGSSLNWIALSLKKTKNLAEVTI